MTREELVEIMERNLDSFMATDTDGCGYPIVNGDTIEKCADIILSALAKEREGEVVLWDGWYNEMKDDVAIFYGYRLEGKRGQLIFRPAKEGA